MQNEKRKIFLLQVECLRSLTKDEVLSFYADYLCPGSTNRKKLACHVISGLAGGAGEEPVPPATAQLVQDITSFKCSLPLYPLAQPFVALEQLRRTVEETQ
jgi:hypothetical protein